MAVSAVGSFLARRAACQACKHASARTYMLGMEETDWRRDNRPEMQTNKLTRCTVIAGDGIGPEMMEGVYRVMEALRVPVKFEEYIFSELHHTMSADVEVVMNSITRNGVCLIGRLMTPQQKYKAELGSMSVTLRKWMDCYANVVFIESISGLKLRNKNLDFFIIRENTEGEMSNMEHESVPGVVEAIKVITEAKSLKVAKFAFDFATKLGRKKVTAVHKANIMKLSDGMFLRSCREVAALYPNIEFEEMIVDNCTMQLTSNPHQFDVLVMPNLYGSIIANIGAGLIGGAGICAGANYSADAVMFEPGARHAFVKASTKDIANPTAMLLSSCLMLAHSNMLFYAKVIRRAIRDTIKEGKVLTMDMGGKAKSSEFITAVIDHLPKNA